MYEVWLSLRCVVALLPRTMTDKASLLDGI